ncbi:MAG: PD40 domain-containing protein [Candidatus Krumholzibacteria bacterium]|nr:PD40 domain-containing protein [Candidatus Krumholzibacteria bacterium]
MIVLPSPKSRKAAWAILTILLSVFTAATALASDPVMGDPDPNDMRLLRNPDIHGDIIVFTYGGDLWTVSAQGGQARRLTGSIGFESAPKFSPDGITIAFSGNYDGNHDVYTIPAGGGEPARLTWHPGWDRVIDWQPDGASVRFQSARESHTGRDLQLYTVATEGGLPRKVILPTAGLSSYSPDGKKIAYNRISRENRTWKRYKGGMAQNVWVYDFDANDTQQITDWVGSDNFPMWHGNKIYYNSDQSGRLQIWVYDTVSSEHHQVTEHEEYDVKHPSLGPDAIVYENGGRLFVLDLATEESRQVTVSLFSDNVLTRPTIKDVGSRIGGGDLSPDANRAVFSARGDIFTVPAEKGNIRNLTATPGIREREAVWSPDGKTVAYLSDRTGEYEIWIRPADGKGEEKQLTTGSKTYKMQLDWSPDSKHLAVSDAAMNLWIVDADSGKMKKVDQATNNEIQAWNWSPQGGWLTYSKSEENNFSSIFIYNVADGKTHRVTTDFTEDGSPCFDDEGKYLFFVSARSFNPTLGGFDLKPLWTNMDELYLVTLREDVEHPFPPESDEAEVEGDEDDEDDEDSSEDDDKDKDKEDKDGDEEKSEEKEVIKIDLEGLSDRMVELDVSQGNYFNLHFTEGKLFYTSRLFTAGGGRDPRGGGSDIMVFDMEEREAEKVLPKVGGWVLSRDGKKILYASNGTFGIIDAKADQKPAEEPLRTGEMQAKVDPRAEWRQMFRDAWRQERDFFYDPGMHGVDWDHMYQRYGQLIPYVAHGADFSYVLGEMIGELNSSHSYVRPGDMPHAKQVGAGLLGCTFELDRESDRYRFGHIFSERDWNSDTPTPLNQPGQEVGSDDYILTIDGVDLKAGTNPYSLLENKVDAQVVLEIGPNPDGKDSREITVVPIANDRALRYEAWVQTNRRRVDELSDGRIGYLHMPNTAIGGQVGFAKGYYPNLRKEGLIIDERFNGGGFIPDFFMNILRQKLVNLWKPRYGQDWRTPGTAFLGHMAMIANGYAGSGGDALPYYFKYYELGDVIGTRTWGGLVGISRGIGLMDGGSVTFPEFGLFNVNGEWDVENHGVEPTIEIDNLPHEEIAGRDPQLEKAVETLLQKIKDEPVVAPQTPGSFPRDKN